MVERVSNQTDLLKDYGHHDLRFGWVDVVQDEILKETLKVYNLPGLVMLKEGKYYHTTSLSDTYLPVENFIKNMYEQSVTQGFIGGRITLLGLYFNYWHRGLV